MLPLVLLVSIVINVAMTSYAIYMVRRAARSAPAHHYDVAVAIGAVDVEIKLRSKVRMSRWETVQLLAKCFKDLAEHTPPDEDDDDDADHAGARLH